MPKDNVVVLDNETRLDIPFERVLAQADGEIAKGIVLGYDNDGELYFASSIADGGDILWLLERGKQRLMDVTESDDG